MKAFLSSTYVDLIEHRRAAKDALEGLGMQVGRMEVFGARPQEPVAACLSEIEDCDLFIGIYAHRYGHIPSGTDISITEAELQHAERHAKPLFCFVVDENHPWPPPLIEEEPGKTKLRKLKERLSAAAVRDVFTTAESLAATVAKSVGRHLAQTASDAGYHERMQRVDAALPCRYGTLYGRDDEIERLSGPLSPTSPYRGVAVEAIGGMGKTALAREFCVRRTIWRSYDLILGAQALKRQMHFDAGAARSHAVRLDEQGTVLRMREFLITLAGQLGIPKAELRSEAELEREIRRCLQGHSALIILDNLETMEDTVDVLALFNRLCTPPSHKALITTRQLPAEAPGEFIPLRLSAITDPSACRALVVDQLRRDIDPSTTPEEAIDAIVEVARGHPLALEILAGKLVTQGAGSISKLREDWASNPLDALNDEYVSALCKYVFDKRFLHSVGEIGVALLSVIALESAGVDEEAARLASGMTDEAFDVTLSKLFQANCIRRELHEELSLLTMHPLTQAYFRSLALA